MPEKKQKPRVNKTPDDKLAQTSRHNELILAAVGEGIYGISRDGLATFINPAAIEMTGWLEADLLGKPIHDLHHHTKVDGSPYPRDECPIYAATRDGAVHHVDDEIFWRKDGSSFPAEYTSTPIVEDGKLAGAVVVFKDITKRKKTERELLEAYAEVERMKEQLEAENIYLQEELNVEHDFAGLVGQSPAIQQVLNQVDLVAPTEASVLITGESGTGKAMPITSTRANRLTVLRLKPKTFMAIKVPITDTGTARLGIRVVRQFCRNR